MGMGAADTHPGQERPDRVLEPTPEAYLCVDRDGLVIDWSAQAERILGWTRDQVLGRSIAETILATGSREAGLAAILGAIEGPAAARRLELSALDGDGRCLAIELVLWAGPDGRVHAFLHQASAGGQGEQAGAQLDAIAEASTDAIVSHDLEGRILSWNPAATLTYGYSAEEALGRHIFITVPAERRAELERLTESLRGGKRVPYHGSVHRRKDGSELEVALSVSAIRDPAGKMIGVSTIAHDLTEQRWITSTLDQTLASLPDLLAKAHEAEARSRRFLADAAHQLRTPIAGLRACAEALPRAGSTAQRERLLGDIVRESTRAAQLLNALLTLARLDQGRTIDPTPCNVLALCREEAERAGRLCPTPEIAVRAVEDTGGTPALDRESVAQILDVLLENACRHARTRIEILVSSSEDAVELRVRDDGPGLADEMVERAFERFASLDGKGGSGLGLPIAKELARAHGGDLCYEQGAFVVCLRSPGREPAAISD